MNPTTSIPLLRENEQQLLILRRRLEIIFVDLHLIHDVTSVCEAACDAVNSDTDAEVSHILRRCASDKLHGQMEELTSIIEQLGGRTRLSDDDAPDNDDKSESEDHDAE